MAKDAVATMGTILSDDAGGRDAVHVAVFSAFLKQDLKPGQYVSIVEHAERDVEVIPVKGHRAGVAIVDPFLPKTIDAGERFWAYLYPRTITSLSHKWGHPAFEAVDSAGYVPPSAKLQSEAWLKDWAAQAGGPEYSELINTAILLANTKGESSPLSISDDYAHSSWDDEYWHFSGMDAHGEIPPEFWGHLENVTGLKFEKRPGYFSCSC